MNRPVKNRHDKAKPPEKELTLQFPPIPIISHEQHHAQRNLKFEKDARIQMRPRRGFTLLEMVVVVAVIALLMIFLLPALSRARAQGRCVTCMSNIRQLTTAYLAYADANDGKLYRCDSNVAQIAFPPDSQEIEISALTSFAGGDRRLFHCIEDLRDGCRSYSINDYLGGSFPFIGMKHVPDLLRIANAARTFVFIEETPPKTKNGYTGGFVVLPYPADRWADSPAILHSRGTCLSFADGHCEFWQWSDDRTRALPLTKFPQTTDNPDLIHLQAVSGQPGSPIQ